MGRLQEQLPAMMALAHAHTESARVELAGKLADVFLIEDAQLSLREEELVNELIDRLMQTHTPACAPSSCRNSPTPPACRAAWRQFRWATMSTSRAACSHHALR